MDLVHHDNRDFDVIPNYQPCCGPSFNEQTILLDKQPGVRCVACCLDRAVDADQVLRVAWLARYLLEDLHQDFPVCK